MVIGYYADWTAERYPLADIPATKLTHVNYEYFGRQEVFEKMKQTAKEQVLKTK